MGQFHVNGSISCKRVVLTRIDTFIKRVVSCYLFIKQVGLVFSVSNTINKWVVLVLRISDTINKRVDTNTTRQHKLPPLALSLGFWNYGFWLRHFSRNCLLGIKISLQLFNTIYLATTVICHA